MTRLAAPFAALRFLLELVAIAALAYAGWHVGPPLATRVLAMVAFPVVAAVLWGLVVAPRARFSVPRPGRLGVELIVFAAACTGLRVAGARTVAVVVAALVVVYELVRLALHRAGVDVQGQLGVRSAGKSSAT